MKRISSILWGVALVAVGLIFGLNALGITDINVFFSGWWTLFIIVPCFIGLFTESGKTGNIIGLIIGVVLLLACQKFFSIGIVLKLIVPFIIVAVGISLIFKDVFNKRAREISKKLKEKDGGMPEYCATFTGQNLNFAGEEFNGAELTAVFGGIKCDLRYAKIPADTVINICAVFGGVDVLLPDNVNVKIVSTSIFGGMSNKKYTKADDGAVTVYINGSCIFGGADIK